MAPDVYAVALSLLGALLLAFALGRIAAARDEDTGRFSWPAAGHALAVPGFRGAWAAIEAFFSSETSGLERMRMAGSLFTFLGLIVVAVQPPISDAARDLYGTQRAFEESGWSTFTVAAPVAGWLFVAIGLTLHVWRWVVKGRLSRALPPGARDPGAAEVAITPSLPAVLDLC